ncbi:MAG: HNH endonuclease signature motif containing protein [Alphaproteobacteria bacterium]
MLPSFKRLRGSWNIKDQEPGAPPTHRNSDGSKGRLRAAQKITVVAPPESPWETPRELMESYPPQSGFRRIVPSSPALSFIDGQLVFVDAPSDQLVCLLARAKIMLTRRKPRDVEPLRQEFATEIAPSFASKAKPALLKIIGENLDKTTEWPTQDPHGDIQEILSGYRIHHKIPLEFGGDNRPGNLVIVHDGIHRIFKEATDAITRDMKVGQSRPALIVYPEGPLLMPRISQDAAKQYNASMHIFMHRYYDLSL